MLIELLIVVVIIGILAASAIPKFANTKSKAYVTAMKSDLRNLVTAEEAFFSDSTYYTTATTLVTKNSLRRDLRCRREHHEPDHFGGG
jgi:Tfp pilus assembly protein PilE